MTETAIFDDQKFQNVDFDSLGFNDLGLAPELLKALAKVKPKINFLYTSSRSI